jgi:hypothetical protein
MPVDSLPSPWKEFLSEIDVLVPHHADLACGTFPSSSPLSLCI